MSDLLEALFRLQQIDDRLSRTHKKQEEIPAKIHTLEQRFEEAKKEQESRKQQLTDATLRQKNLEKELLENQEQIKKKQARQFEVKTNEEYRAMLKEIEFTQEANSKIEDQILILFDEIDALKGGIEDKEMELGEKAKDLEAEKKKLEQEAESIKIDHEAFQQERQKLSVEIEPAVLRDYEKIRTLRAGQAVVLVDSEVCPGCHLFVPPQTINEVLQTGEIRKCPHCRRILYCVLKEGTG